MTEKIEEERFYKKVNKIENLVFKIEEYAKGKINDVKRGAETPILAALLLQKYGEGIIQSVITIYDDNRIADFIQVTLDREVSKIDPEWREHAKERWERRPADIV